MPQFAVTLDRFDGGLNTKATPLHGSLDQSPDLQDVIFDDLGAVETRRGITKFGTAIAAASIDMLHSYQQNNGTKSLLAFCNGSMYRASGNTFVTVPSAQSVYTAGQRVLALTLQNKVFITNGGTTPYKYDGTDFTQWGVAVPAAPVSNITAYSDGLLSGAFKYVVVGLNTFGVKGDYATASTEITIASKQIEVAGIYQWPTSAGVQYKLLCRNTAGASGLYYIVTQLTNAATSYVDNNPDTYLETDAPLDNGMPQHFTCMIAFQGRIFAASSTSANPMFLYYSNVDDPEIFPSDSIIRVGEGDGYAITGLAILSNALIISKNDGRGNGSMYLLYMPDANPDNWSLTKLDTESGSQSAKVMVNFSNYLAFLNKYGVFDLNQQAVGAINSDPLSFNIEADIYLLATQYLSKATAITWKNKVWFSVPYGTTQSYNNRIYQYDYIRGRGNQNRNAGAWSRFTGHNISELAIHDGNLYGGSSLADGYVYQLDTGYNDDSSAINSYFQTMAIVGQPEHQSFTKTWRYCYITVECTGDWYMTLSYSNDFKDEAGNSIQILLDPENSKWDTAIVGVSKWGAGYLRKRVQLIFRNSTSKAIQLKFATNTADQYFKVHKVEVFYNLRGLR